LNKAKEDGEDASGGEGCEEEETMVVTEEDIDILDKEASEKKRILTKTTSMKLGCLGMLNTIYSRLGLTEQPTLSITAEFLEKVEEAKVMSKVESC